MSCALSVSYSKKNNPSILKNTTISRWREVIVNSKKEKISFRLKRLYQLCRGKDKLEQFVRQGLKDLILLILTNLLLNVLPKRKKPKGVYRFSVESTQLSLFFFFSDDFMQDITYNSNILPKGELSSYSSI